MATMRKYCGRRLKVLRRADKILAEGFGIRGLQNAVILEGATCDGGPEECQRACFVLWKEAWLKRANKSFPNRSFSNDTSTAVDNSRWQSTNLSSFSCQSRNLIKASRPLSKWSIQRYRSDFTSGVYKPSEYLQMALSLVFLQMRALVPQNKADTHIGLAGGLRRTPTISLSIQPGDVVRVKSRGEIQRTLDYNGRNRGLEFTQEMERHCEKTFRVRNRVEKMIIEQSGEMRQIADTVLLEGAFCDGKAHKGCPRNCYCLWREIWLEISVKSA